MLYIKSLRDADRITGRSVCNIHWIVSGDGWHENWRVHNINDYSLNATSWLFNSIIIDYAVDGCFVFLYTSFFGYA